ncbi:phosphatase PAP2 family protein [Flavobacterium sp. RHBU_3]|uniref:phosphatase PAP2 family protein n=1 Tax=Flavobacterium sp. RHBU_3 TaxID=3391184 RepID=UPI0039855AAF
MNYLSGVLKEISKKTNTNYCGIRFTCFIPPLSFLLVIIVYLYYKDALSVHNYIELQKSWFISINAKLSQFPNLEYNLTQLGDALIFLSLLSILIIYVPKIWEALLFSLLISSVFSCTLKKIIAVPRPAAVFNNSSFTIIGKKLCSHSLPSGHSITIFAILTPLLFAFAPKKPLNKALYYIGAICIGILIALSRVGVGAHYPLDVVFGCTIGYISGASAIFLSKKYKLWCWIGDRKHCPVLVLIFLTCCVFLITKIFKENLTIYYVSLSALLASTYKITYIYVKK